MRYQPVEASISIGHRVKSALLPLSHGGNTGSNPVGDANQLKDRKTHTFRPRAAIRKKYGKGAVGRLASKEGSARALVAHLNGPLKTIGPV